MRIYVHPSGFCLNCGDPIIPTSYRKGSKLPLFCNKNACREAKQQRIRSMQREYARRIREEKERKKRESQTASDGYVEYYYPVGAFANNVLTPGHIEYSCKFSNGKEYTCTASSLKMARIRRDEWMQRKKGKRK